MRWQTPLFHVSTKDTLRMLRWPDYFADPPSDTTSRDINIFRIPKPRRNRFRRMSQ